MMNIDIEEICSMCDCCESEGRDPRFHTGSRKVMQVRLFKVYMGKVARINLCKLCDIELFHVGEIRFLQNHMQLTKSLSTNQRQFT